MAKPNKSEQEPNDLIEAAKKEAAKILEDARRAADTEVAAAKDEAEEIRKKAGSSTPDPSEDVKPVPQERKIITLKVSAVKKGYANHRIYEAGSKFVYRYWSHQIIGKELVPVTQEKALGGWMVTPDDPRYGKNPDEIQQLLDEKEDAEASENHAKQNPNDLNVL